jgi:hypothetical protein
MKQMERVVTCLPKKSTQLKCRTNWGSYLKGVLPKWFWIGLLIAMTESLGQSKDCKGMSRAMRPRSRLFVNIIGGSSAAAALRLGF